MALIDGVEVPCWPNAGEMNAVDGSDRSWLPEDNIQVRLCTQEEHVAASKSAPKTSPKVQRVAFQLHAVASVLGARSIDPFPRHSDGGIMAKAQWAKRSNKRKYK